MPNTMNIFEESPDHDTFGGRFSRARDASGLSTENLAWRLGVKATTINAWETDRSLPGSHRLTLLSGLMGVSLSWLLYGIGTGPSEPTDDETADAVADQLARLKLLHLETGQLLGTIQGNLDRLSSGSEPHSHKQF